MEIAPLELTNIEFSSDIPLSNENNNREYQITHVTIISGLLNSHYFGLEDENELPSTIGTMDIEKIPFRSIS